MVEIQYFKAITIFFTLRLKTTQAIEVFEQYTSFRVYIQLVVLSTFNTVELVFTD